MPTDEQTKFCLCPMLLQGPGINEAEELIYRGKGSMALKISLPFSDIS